MPAKNDDAVHQEHRGAWFAGKPGSYVGGSHKDSCAYKTKSN
ncbi:MAG: hypothetical protein ACRER5_24190 [Pseudomonas sp.]